MSKPFFTSTRSNQAPIPFSEAVVKGIAPDGGLYVPTFIPSFSVEDSELMHLSYQALAKKILGLYLTDFSDEEIAAAVDAAYDTKFSDSRIAPVTSIDRTHFIELYHGRTLAFKDMALSILPYLLKTAMNKQAIEEELVILTATSGDTGKAALEGFANVAGVSIIVFYPTDGVSDIQKRQMTTQTGANTAVFGINGNFDDAQNGVKALFLDEALIASLKQEGFLFSSANSINIGRLLPQIVYYYSAYLDLVRRQLIQLGDAVNVVVPTGNFGNLLAATYAKQMGLPVKTFICASNSNHVLTDFMKTGTYDLKRPFVMTASPSMDILISSNLERFLYTISGGNSEKTNALMRNLKINQTYTIDPEMKSALECFYSGYANDPETLDTIKQLYDKHGYVVDTHTAVAYKVHADYVSKTGDQTHTLIASTASPFKFTRSVMTALGTCDTDASDFDLIHRLSHHTGLAIPEVIKNLSEKPIVHTRTIDKDDLKVEVTATLKKRRRSIL